MTWPLEDVREGFADFEDSSVDAMQDLEVKDTHLYSYGSRVTPFRSWDTGISSYGSAEYQDVFKALDTGISSYGSAEYQNILAILNWRLSAFSPQIVVTPMLTPKHVLNQSLGSVFFAALGLVAPSEEHDLWMLDVKSYERDEEVAPNAKHNVRLPPKNRQKVEIEITGVRKGKPQRVRPRDLLLEEGQAAYDMLPEVNHHVRLPPKNRQKVEIEITGVRKGKPQRVRPRDLV